MRSASAHAQDAMRRIGVMMALDEDQAEEKVRLQALLRRLEQLGWVDGRNVRIQVRSARGSMARSREIAAEFAALAPDVIISTGSTATAAIKRATPSIPVVFALVNEPVAQGFVQSLQRPGGNITGFTLIDFTLILKLVELLKSIDPGMSRVGLMFNPENYSAYNDYVDRLQAEPRLGVDVVQSTARSPAEIFAAIAALAAQPRAGLAILPDGGFTLTNQAPIRAALERHPMPAIAFWRQFVADGGLMSYGPDTIDVFRRSADYADRILKGAKPAELPVQQPVKFDLVISAKAAAVLGLAIPPTLLAQADEVTD
ncbi:ABC transporter substrate-binding protein [Methylobacterium sp. J-070]|uniref:ABC transporter substrate-binding protein n=1 Tax=Methylobacterium sp. J-070 TaxID=2836650 RepID=UPI001FB9C087|nr:ABC transporter substrate-binding protein [Methylobacterium sp. J-070]MCJ2050682.1 ABC transporter substrate-binding protein [Methylobacterium sp. J-070]